jgi:hypothetical protein
MRTSLDHVVIVVESLAAGSEPFRAAGFTVLPGGRHDAIPTENTLIAFADGTYLELLAMRDPGARSELRALRGSEAWDAHLRGASAIARRFLPNLVRPDGVADAVVTRDSLARFTTESRRRGFVMAGPVAMRRERRDAPALEWLLALPAEPALPFVIEDRTPRAWRVPGGEDATRHANGARGIAAIGVRAVDPVAVAMALADLFGASLAALPDGRTQVTLAGSEWRLQSGEPAGACAVEIAGAAPLGEALAALGVHAAGVASARAEAE